MTLATSGNQVALEDALDFNLELFLGSANCPFTSLTTILLGSANIIIEDLDGE